MANLVPILLNGVYSTVQAGSSAIGSASATGVNVATGDGAKFGTIGANQFIPAVIVDTSTSPETIKEYVWITAVSTDALTVVRQAEESSRYAASTTSIQAGYTIAAVASAAALYAPAGGVAGTLPADHGFAAWTGDPMLFAAINTVQSITAGVLWLARVPVPLTVTVSNIYTFVVGAGSGLTTGQCLAGIYSSAGTRLALTGDQHTNWAFTGFATCPLTGSVTLTGGAGVFVWIAFLANGTTMPRLYSLAGNGTVEANMNMTAATYRAATSGSAQTVLPSSITPSSNARAGVPWAAIG